MIVDDGQGVYRWVYEFHLMKNPVIFLTVFKIMGGLALLGVLIMVGFNAVDIGKGYSTWADLFGSLKGGLLFILFWFVLVGVGYTVYAAMHHWKYCVVFTMNNEGIEHRQMPEDYKKSEAIADLNIIAGFLTGNLTQIGIGLTSQRDVLATDFKDVRSIQGMRAFSTIKVNEPLGKNQVYVDKEDYDFVYNYIVERCPNAKIR